jgi:hypothetical protein
MKRLIVVLFTLSVLVAGCMALTGPSDPNVSTNGALPEGMFKYAGRLTRPADGMYLVYATPDITGDPQLSAHLDNVLSAANDLTGGRVRFVVSNRSDAPIRIAINPATGGAGDSGINFRSYYCAESNIKIASRREFLTNIPLHEIGHFLFGLGHSPELDDIMCDNRSDYTRLRFSDNEYRLWSTALQFPVGATR